MAEYCKQCAQRIFGADTGDFAGLCKPGETTLELCEGCGGFVEVNHEGKRYQAQGDNMFGEFKIHAGDFAKNRKGMFTGGTFSMPDADDLWAWKNHHYGSNDVEELAVASEESVKRLGGTVGWGAAGAVILGPVGLLAGLLAGGRKKEVTFIVKFSDGKKALCTADSKIFTKMQASQF